MAPEIAEFLKTLAGLPVAEAVRSSTWFYPFLETLHVIGLGLLFGGIASLDLRLLGLNRDLPVQRLARHVLPWVWAGFAINVASGVLLFLSDAVAFAGNLPFQIKMLLLAAAGLNAFWFQFDIYRDAETWNRDFQPPLKAKIASAISLVIWLAVIAAGRMIAYWE